jgi:CRP-like cAMP-binding protein
MAAAMSRRLAQVPLRDDLRLVTDPGNFPQVVIRLDELHRRHLRRLTEAASDLVFLDLPRRVARVLLAQPRSDDGTIRPALSQEELAHQPQAPGEASAPRCAVSNNGDRLRCMTGP